MPITGQKITDTPEGLSDLEFIKEWINDGAPDVDADGARALAGYGLSLKMGDKMNFLDLQSTLRRFVQNCFSTGMSPTDLGLIEGEDVWGTANHLLTAKFCGETPLVHPRLIGKPRADQCLSLIHI